MKCRPTRPTEKLQQLSDGGGLELGITPNGARLWCLAYRYASRGKLLAIGPYPLISLAAARAARDDVKHLLLKGMDRGASETAGEAGALGHYVGRYRRRIGWPD